MGDSKNGEHSESKWLPVRFSVDYPERLSRAILLLKTFLGWLYVIIPHGIILSLYGIAAFTVQFMAWWTILFTGKYPKGMFDFVVGYMRWSSRVASYTGFLTDKYPPFSGKGNVSDSPVRFSVDYPKRLSRSILLLRTFLGWLYVGIPQGILSLIYGIAALTVQFIAWWIILFTGKYPKGMFDFVITYWRWLLRLSVYMCMFTDVYPPFPDFARLCWRLFRDSRVPTHKKVLPVIAGIGGIICFVYVMFPFDALPNPYSFIGQLDDTTLILSIVLLIIEPSIWLFIRICPEELVREHTCQIDENAP
jgi:uncharacterized membrane protein YkvA (DUF1232 family)